MSGRERGCVDLSEAALDAAHDGDVIRIGKGVFAGGITITKSVTLIGRDARRTIIRGGGPVISIGEFLGPSPVERDDLRSHRHRRSDDIRPAVADVGRG